MDGKGKRYNQGKTRHGLTPAFAQEQYAKVLTMGAEKYGVNNYRRGMSWLTILDSTSRHIEKIKKGEDYDIESGLLHSAHVMCNAAFLTEYYKIYPQGDDRPHSYLKCPKIGLDIDEVLADFISHYNNKYNLETVPEVWNFDSKIPERIEELKDDYEFWSTVPVLTKASDIPFEPHCYITSRPCKSEWTAEWLEKNGFPTMPVYTVGHNKCKIDVAKEAGIDWFIDDRYENFVKLNNAGIFCYLYDAPHNQRYNVGHRRIKALKDIYLFN